MSEESARISPTAHYTGFVWYRHGLSHPALRTRQGALYHASLAAVNATYARLNGGLNLETLLLSRHAAIDAQLTEAIESGQVGQVLEIACGLSPRGFRFAQRYADRGLVYVEGDLKAMSTRKRRALDDAGLRGENHHVVQLDALTDNGDHSVDAIFDRHFDVSVGTAVVTEGLVNYFDRATIEGLWARVARALSRHPAGLYLSDIHVADEAFARLGARLFKTALRVFARGEIHAHYETAEQCVQALSSAGFGVVRVDPPVAYGAAAASPKTEQDIVRVIDART